MTVFGGQSDVKGWSGDLLLNEGRKSLNLALIYGLGQGLLAERLGCTVEEAGANFTYEELTHRLARPNTCNATWRTRL